MQLTERHKQYWNINLKMTHVCWLYALSPLCHGWYHEL